MKYIPTIITRYHKKSVQAMYFTKEGSCILGEPVPFSTSALYSHNTAMYNMLDKLVSTGIYETKPIVKSFELANFTGFKYYLEEV